MTEINTFEGYSAVTFTEIPANVGFESAVLKAVAEAGINIDMISQTPPKSDRVSFGFSFSDDDIPALLKIMSKITSDKNVTPFVTSGNVKIRILSDEMCDQAGFAAKVFELIDSVSAEVLMVSTGNDEICLLVPESGSDNISEVLKNL
ncbi:MAG: ACT domain-containing protein [Eubacterium sp.]|nr:ACT domain-containing protein [Eubacterium sp.]